MRILSISLAISCSLLNGADQQAASKAMYHYQRAEYSQARTEFKKGPWKKEDAEKNELLLAECIGAVALKSRHPEQLKKALSSMAIADSDYRQGESGDTTIAIANGDFGTTIFCGYYLKRFNDKRQAAKLPPIPLHLKGKQKILYALLTDAGITNITTDKLHCDADTRVAPPLAWIDAVHFFEEHEPYLKPNSEALEYWDKRIDDTKFNIAIAWRPAVDSRSLPLREQLGTILQDDNAHVYLLQGQPAKMITKSAYDKLSPEQQEKQAFDWVPDDRYAAWQDQITIVEEKHGPFIDSLAILSRMPYFGCGTALLHIAGSVKNGKAAVVLPLRKDGLSNRYWRIGERTEDTEHDGQQVPGHGKHIRLFECAPTKEYLTPIVTLLKKWQQEEGK